MVDFRLLIPDFRKSGIASITHGHADYFLQRSPAPHRVEQARPAQGEEAQLDRLLLHLRRRAPLDDHPADILADLERLQDGEPALVAGAARVAADLFEELPVREVGFLEAQPERV